MEHPGRDFEIDQNGCDTDTRMQNQQNAVASGNGKPDTACSKLWCLLKTRARSPMGATRLENKHLGIAAILTTTSNDRGLKVVGCQNVMVVTMLRKI
jgi:hypothetical protein